MATIATVAGSDVPIQTPQRGARLNPGAFVSQGPAPLDSGALTARARATLAAVDADFRGKRAVAGGVQDVSEAFQTIARDMMQANRARIAADADFRMRTAQQTFVESLRGDGDESTWGERANEVFERTREEILNAAPVPPGMRKELDFSLRSWGQALGIKAQTMAAVQTVNRASVAIRKSYDEAARDGDAVGMANAVGMGRQSKLDPVEMDQLEQGIPRALALTAIENGFRVNPQGTYDLLSSGGSLPIADQNGKAIVPSKVFPPKELQSLIVTARREASAWQSENYQNLLATADPMTGLIPEGVIRAQMESGAISAKTGQTLLATQARTVAEEQRKQAAYLHTEIGDPTAWIEDPEATAAELRAKAEMLTDPKLKQQEMNAIERKLIATRKAAKSGRDHIDRTVYERILAQADNQPAWANAIDERAQFLIGETASIGDPTLRQKAINYVNQQKASLRKNGELAQGPVQRQILQQIDDDRRAGFAIPTGAVEKGGLIRSARTEFQKPAAVKPADISDSEIRKLYGPGVTRAQVVEAEQLHYNQVVEKMRAWFRDPANANATYEQANKYRAQLEQPYIMEVTKAALRPDSPVVVTTEAEYNALPPNAVYVREPGGRPKRKP